MYYARITLIRYVGYDCNYVTQAFGFYNYIETIRRDYYESHGTTLKYYKSLFDLKNYTPYEDELILIRKPDGNNFVIYITGHALHKTGTLYWYVHNSVYYYRIGNMICKKIHARIDDHSQITYEYKLRIPKRRNYRFISKNRFKDIIENSPFEKLNLLHS